MDFFLNQRLEVLRHEDYGMMGSGLRTPGWMAPGELKMELLKGVATLSFQEQQVKAPPKKLKPRAAMLES